MSSAMAGCTPLRAWSRLTGVKPEFSRVSIMELLQKKKNRRYIGQDICLSYDAASREIRKYEVAVLPYQLFAIRGLFYSKQAALGVK